jgi:pantothenate kinase
MHLQSTITCCGAGLAAFVPSQQADVLCCCDLCICLQEAYARRGAHWTFDGTAFVAAIRRLKQQGAASLPSFDHGVGDPIEDDIQIDAARHAVVLVEGNYLFLEQEPWVQLRQLFDDAWFVDCPIDVAMQRVFDRQVAIGLAAEVSLGRIAGNDRPNAVLVNASKSVARLLVPSSVPFAGTAAVEAAVGTEAAAERSSS